MSGFRPNLPPEALEEAAAWLARLNEPAATDRDRGEFVAWLKASPVHVRYYLELTGLEVDLRTPELYQGLDAEEAPEGRTPTAAGAEVLALPVRPRAARALARGTRPWRPWVAAASVLAALGLGLLFASRTLPSVEHYTSAPGELRRVALEDGSLMTLNARSEATVRYDARSRQVLLESGEVLFRVSHDPDRPFRVRVGNNVIQALGTEFNVRRRGQDVLLTVVDGRVRVLSAAVTVESTGSTPGGLQPARVEVGAGEQFSIPASGLGRAGHSGVRELSEEDLAVATLWTRHRLSFNRAPVSEVVAELNRYNREQLAVDDPELAAREVSGTFDVRQPQAFIALLRQQGGVELEARDGGGLRLVPSGDAGRLR